MRIVAFSTAVFFTLVGATSSSRHHATPPAAIKTLDPLRSFVVSDAALLQGFTFQRVLDQLVARSGVPNITTAQLYRQWFDTQNPKPGLADPAGPHCDDFITNGTPSFNGFPRRCPTFEGILAAAPFTANEYIPLAVINRFDQAPADGANCGQYRLIFARPLPFRQHLHVIFEATLRNPTPSAGLAGCRAVAQFWAGLTNVDSPADRRDLLESFFFDGLPGFPPVIDPAHYGPGSGGGIRTSQIGWDGNLRMYQFRLTKDCQTDCTLRMMPDVLENLPFGHLFDTSQTLPATQAFQDAFIEQVPNLAVRDVNGYFMDIPRQFLMVESNPKDNDNDAFLFFDPFSRSKGANPGFRNRIQERLTAINSPLTPEQIVLRATTLNCFGCHGAAAVGLAPIGDGLSFPASVDSIQHVTEDHPQTGELGLPRFVISPAMRDVFIPHRMKILIDFLNSGKAPVKSQ